MPNDDPVGPLGVIDFSNLAMSGRSAGPWQRRSRLRVALRSTALESHNIRDRATGDLLGHRHVTGGSRPLFRALRIFDHPALMEIVKVTRFNSGPVVNRHDEPPRADFDYILAGHAE